jgi:hypothetical protein
MHLVIEQGSMSEYGFFNLKSSNIPNLTTKHTTTSNHITLHYNMKDMRGKFNNWDFLGNSYLLHTMSIWHDFFFIEFLKKEKYTFAKF